MSLATTDLTTSSAPHTVTGEELASYRTVVRSALGLEPDGAASPVYPFVLSTDVFDTLVDRLGDGGNTLVHLSQDIEVHRLVTAGEQVTATARLCAARREARGLRLALQASIDDDGGTRVALLNAGVLLMGQTSLTDFGEIPGGVSVRPSHDHAPITSAFSVDREFVRHYADTARDHNPIHLDDEAAAAAGFPGVIAHGMSIVAVISELAAVHLADGDAGRVRGIGVRFSAPVLPDESLEVTFQRAGEGDRYAFTCRTPRGIALKGGWLELDGRP